MLKTDMMELKKTFKKDKVTITKICTCYVCGQDKKMFTSFSSFLNLPDEEFYKYLEILKTLLSTKAGDTMQSIRISDEDCRRAFDSLRWSELRQEGIAETVLTKIKECYAEENNYAIFLFYSAYDVPKKGTDKLKQDESDEAYNAIYGVICPVELSSPGLSYFENKQEFHNRERDPIVGKPVIGFLYPDFHERSIDDSKVAFGICDPKHPHNEIPTELFGSIKTPTAAEQAKMLEEALTETLFDEDAKKIAKVTKNIRQDVMAVTEKIKEDKEFVEYTQDKEEVNNEPQPKIIAEPVISLDNIKETIVNSGIEKDKAEKVIETYKSLSPTSNDKIRVDKTSKVGKIKCEKISVSMPAEDMDRVKIEMMGGKKCIIIELPDENSEVSFNGIVCK